MIFNWICFILVSFFIVYEMVNYVLNVVECIKFFCVCFFYMYVEFDLLNIDFVIKSIVINVFLYCNIL